MDHYPERVYVHAPLREPRTCLLPYTTYYHHHRFRVMIAPSPSSTRQIGAALKIPIAADQIHLFSALPTPLPQETRNLT